MQLDNRRPSPHRRGTQYRGGSRLRVAALVAIALVATACGSNGDSEGADAPTDAATETGNDTETTPTDTDDDTAGDEPEPPTSDAEAPEGSEDWTYPGATWALQDPADHGLDPEGIQALVEYGESTASNCVAVVRDGALVAEQYWYDTDAESRQEVFSVSKSVTATLVGIAQDQGHLDIEQPASDFITEWQGTDSEDITIANLLANDSGRYYDFITDYTQMTNAEDRTAFAIALDQQHPVGEHWEYNNSAIQVLQGVLNRATGQTVNEFAAEHLFDPTGMGSSIATDPSGNEATFMGTQASCLDMARFGYLHLRDGWWDGAPVVSSSYVTEAISPSQDLNAAYGYLWWLNADGGWVQAAIGLEGDGLFWPSAPLDAYAALGLGSQIVLVLPSENMVVVRLGTFGDSRSDDDGNPAPTANVDALAALALESVAD